MNISRRLIAVAFLATASVVAGCGDDDSASDTVSADAPAELISANDASEEELQTIPGVGPNIAHEIIEYRPYDAETGPAKFREEMGKYLSEDEVESLMAYLHFD